MPILHAPTALIGIKLLWEGEPLGQVDVGLQVPSLPLFTPFYSPSITSQFPFATEKTIFTFMYPSFSPLFHNILYPLLSLHGVSN